MSQPRQLDNPLYRLLHDEKVAEFNKQKPGDGPVDLRGADLRGLDLRLLDASRVDFTDGYFRGADLRGLDLRESNLEGASIAHAQISGAYFPAQLSADEILLSMQFGTRMRYRPN
ncbi:pentapeptide repeat-containing protein [Pseudomonas sp. Gutcm_11s]|uniref:pentapeptide repeat-containing protein n=1 Tax=Pseudomonas sp. Gutcm_11s TaxID=3026088 RepID=UPI0023629EBA|nr:pentapeptide repeat-containing protein [Pseudomonas sp. Gutcm_11s]MDD0845506.1 pentapeptide repeat-containing protein [Pseudomonas sp. Gutcm_11s]